MKKILVEFEFECEDKDVDYIIGGDIFKAKIFEVICGMFEEVSNQHKTYYIVNFIRAKEQKINNANI